MGNFTQICSQAKDPLFQTLEWNIIADIWVNVLYDCCELAITADMVLGPILLYDHWPWPLITADRVPGPSQLYDLDP